MTRARPSKKGCLSCKKLKIKCDEARPVCEYCRHRGRRCVYPDVFRVAGDPLKEALEAYSLLSSSSDSSPFEEEIFSQSRDLTFQVLLGCTAQLLQLLRFELRVLRFFNDLAVPWITYNVNRRQVYIWKSVVPQYFGTSTTIKLAVLALGCLTVMPFCGLDNVLEEESNAEVLARKLEAASGTWKVQRLFADDQLIEQNKQDVNLFRRASEYFESAVKGAREALLEYQKPDSTQQERLRSILEASVANYLIYCFLGMQPWKLIPLVDFSEQEPKSDMLNMALGFKNVLLSDFPHLTTTAVGDIFQLDELQFTPRRKVKFVDDLRKQFDEFLGDISFFDISLEVSTMINDIRECLLVLEKAFNLSIKFNFPVMLYKWLVIMAPQIVPYVRAKNLFALRLLYAYACICVHCRLCPFEQNSWKDYVVWFRDEYGPLNEFDERLYHYVITNRNYIIDDNFTSLKDFDVWAPHFDYTSGNPLAYVMQ